MTSYLSDLHFCAAISNHTQIYPHKFKPTMVIGVSSSDATCRKSMPPVGNLFIISTANDGPDNTITGWLGFLSACGIIWDIILNEFSSSPLLTDIIGNFGSTYPEMPSRNGELNCSRTQAQRMVTSSWDTMWRMTLGSTPQRVDASPNLSYLDRNGMYTEISSKKSSLCICCCTNIIWENVTW